MRYIGKTNTASIDGSRENISIAENHYKITQDFSRMFNAKVIDIQENRKKYLS